MAFPSLPTDNLYKFMALAGIVIVALSAYFAGSRISEVTDRIIDVQENIEIADANVASLQRKAERLEKMVAASIQSTTGGSIPDHSKLTIQYSKEELIVLRREASDAVTEQRIQVVHLEAANKRVKLLNERLPTILGSCVILGIVGLILAVSGFSLWYVKVQKPLDVLLKRDSEKSHPGKVISTST